MKRLLFLFFLISTFTIVDAQIDSTKVYQLIHTGSLNEIDAYIQILEGEKQCSTIKAYKGALFMRAANFEKTPKQKLDIFKQGKQLLEYEIKESPENIEYRFLRLIIQENAPDILHYNQQLSDDKSLIIKGFSTASDFLQLQIRNYSNSSKVLTLSNLP